MASKVITFFAGLIYIFFGASAFVPSWNGGPSPNIVTDLTVHFHFSNLFWQMPMNYPLAGIFILVGLSGVVASLTLGTARLWSRAVLALDIVGLFTGLMPEPIGNVMGLLPLYSWTSAFFLISALFMFYTAFFDGPVPTTALEPVFRQA